MYLVCLVSSPRILPDSTMPTYPAPGMLFLHWSILRQNRLSQQTHSQWKEFTCLGHTVKAPTTWKTKIFATPHKIHTGPLEIFSSENYPDHSKDTEFKRTITNFIKELTEFRENTKKHLNEFKEGSSKHLSGAHENLNMPMTEWNDATVYDLKT